MNLEETLRKGREAVARMTPEERKRSIHAIHLLAERKRKRAAKKAKS
jgi:hypothetical protein